MTELDLSRAERWYLSVILSLVTLLALADIWTDMGEGARWPHLALEFLLAAGGVFGVFLLLKESIRSRHMLEFTEERLRKATGDLQEYRRKSASSVEELRKMIEEQFRLWELTVAETQVAWSLLEGKSMKEIAAIRRISEKTARTQSSVIYAKSGLHGRSELAGFFLGDLLRIKAGE